MSEIKKENGNRPESYGTIDTFKKESNNDFNYDNKDSKDKNDLISSPILENQLDNTPIKILRVRVFAMGIIVSIGGLVFGFDTGQISGFLEMRNFKELFADRQSPSGPSFGNVRAGTMVGLLSIGTLCGALLAAIIADIFGRKIAIYFWNVVFCVGIIIQVVTVDKWYQIVIGRYVTGLGVGGLSVLTPMYQSETAPRQVRGALVSCYQLFITLGLFIAYCVNFATESIPTRRSWRLPLALCFIWPVLMCIGIFFLPESPRWDYRKGNIERAKETLCKSYGVSSNHFEVQRELREIKLKFDAEKQIAGKQKLFEVFTGPRMLYRVLLGIALQGLQQLTGANFFFYYGTSVFASTGLSNSYVTSMILGGVNFGSTIFGLYVVEKFGRRKSLIIGALWMFVCFMIFASIGHFSLDLENPANTPKSGQTMIVFACLFIVAFAMTWGPIVWAVIGEIYPSKYRAVCMGFATASNWICNFLLSFFTPFISADIDFAYGYVFAGFCLTAAIVVYFFLCESQGRSLEEVDTMYALKVNPIKSSKWRLEDHEEVNDFHQIYTSNR